MRVYVYLLAACATAAMSVGCASNAGSKPTMSPGNVEDTKECVIRSGGKDVLKLRVPVDTASNPADGCVYLESNRRHVEFWLVPGATSVNQAVPRVGEQIKNEFNDFKANTTMDLTVGGSPAKRLVGSGTEADDGDPGKADVIVFKAGGHIFVACAHGEVLSPEAQAWMLRLVQLARVP